MRQHAASLVLATALGGCSLIYNPSNLPNPTGDGGPDARPIDAPTDSPIADANPALLMIDSVKSPPLLEGQGDGGSVPAILVVYGMNITKDATIAVTSGNAMVNLELGTKSIANDGNSIAVLVTARVMANVNEAAGDIPLTVTVSQPGATPQTQPWVLKPLDQLTMTGAQAVPAANKRYSRVVVTGDVDFNRGANRAIVQAVADIDVTGRVTANADNVGANRDPGAGGCAGGASGSDGICVGGGKGSTGATGGGGGAGFAVAGESAAGAGGPPSGDPLLSSYVATGAAENKSAGGGGGGLGGHGGGGGGTIELTAGGNINVRTIEAKGASGANGGVGGGGGGGAGGIVVLRAGNMLTFPTMFNISGGAGGSGVGVGGVGSVGRARYDAATTAGTEPSTPTPRRGPMIVRPANPIYEITRPQLTITGTVGDKVDVIVLYPDGGGNQTLSQITLTSAVFMFQPTLMIGLNQICVIIPGGNFARDEAKNCIDVAFIP